MQINFPLFIIYKFVNVVYEKTVYEDVVYEKTVYEDTIFVSENL
jgi:hypothetical protein